MFKKTALFWKGGFPYSNKYFTTCAHSSLVVYRARSIGESLLENTLVLIEVFTFCTFGFGNLIVFCYGLRLFLKIWSTQKCYIAELSPQVWTTSHFFFLFEDSFLRKLFLFFDAPQTHNFSDLLFLLKDIVTCMPLMVTIWRRLSLIFKFPFFFPFHHLSFIVRCLTRLDFPFYGEGSPLWPGWPPYPCISFRECLFSAGPRQQSIAEKSLPCGFFS